MIISAFLLMKYKNVIVVGKYKKGLAATAFQTVQKKRLRWKIWKRSFPVT